MKILVVYYSKTGNNRYLAEKMARSLAGDSEAIKPRLKAFPLLVLFSLTKIGPGIKPLKHLVNGYDRIIVCGPIWMGGLISPLGDFLKKYSTSINRLYFATCCGSSNADKDNKFGYAKVFLQVKNTLKNKYVYCEAFPIGLILPEDKRHDSTAMMKARLSDANFTGEIQKRFENFIQKVRE